MADHRRVASPNYQAGTAQYHINADIAYAIRRYVNVRGDTGFLGEVGAEILVETMAVGGPRVLRHRRRLHIHGVTGSTSTRPSSTTTPTNLMARLNLADAASAVR